MDSLPSPAISPKNSPRNSPSSPVNIGRKRARSSEGSSASSSKRATSEDPSQCAITEAVNATVSYTSADEDSIDAYMRDQGEQEIESSMLELPASVQGQTVHASPAIKYKLIKELRRSAMVPGETWYLISHSWYRRWEKACTGKVDKEGAVLEDQLGPIDNSSLFKLGKVDAECSLIEGVDVEFVPAVAWANFVQWYGEPQHVLARQVISRGLNKQASIELHPPIIRALRLVSMHSPDAENPKEKLFNISSQAKLPELYSELLRILGIPSEGNYRVWVIDNREVDGELISSDRLRKDGGRLLPVNGDDATKTLDEYLIQSDDGLVVEVPDNGLWLVDETTVPSLDASTVNCMGSNGPVFSSGSDFFSKLGRDLASKSDKTLKTDSSSKAIFQITPSSSSGKGRFDGKGVAPGTIGFSNMGNTCFMNSALQCLAHTKELVEYFLTGLYIDELNPDNPLGMQGAIAETFGTLLNRVWLPQSSAAYAPREFKMQLQRFAPQFSGYQQHDSQELVAFLLDGLHEDLNRVLKKPFVEKPDWEGGGDKELVILAKESWEGYMRRNDSVIVDLFQGQYRSTLVCPECKKVSITFDPFMYLTLPLPVQKKWNHTIYYIPWDTQLPHVKVPVEVSRNATFRDVRQLLGRWMKAEPDNLLTLETFSSRFYKYLDDSVPVSDLTEQDQIVCFELPCHAQQSRNWKPDPDLSKNPTILPVHLCKEVPPSYSTFQRPSTAFAHPLVVVLDNDQIRDREKIYNAIVERLERWTAHGRDLYHWEEGTSMEVKFPVPRIPTSLTEIKENGDVLISNSEEDIPEEGDIVDERSAMLEHGFDEVSSQERTPKLQGPKSDLFKLHIESGHDKFGTGSAWSSSKLERWETRERVKRDNERPALLRADDALYCEWDDHLRSYFFGEDLHYEHAKWSNSHWGTFVHPEFKDMQEVSIARDRRSITLNNCLEEFTREEELGEDDLWYCPQCKKHQQATKKFDLWTIPDVLVVHLKRFSNSRILRDKIDAFVDFPTEGLDLEAFCGEREVAKRLVAQGQDISSLGLSDIEEPLLYDLFAVDEHLGGLGGGHYRAYAKNHETDKWYHFDDAHVSPAQASDSVNANAYLLFYKRRTGRPIGGKTYNKIEAAQKEMARTIEEEHTSEVQLPTPPEEDEYHSYPASTREAFTQLDKSNHWRSIGPSPSPSTLGDDNTIEIESNPDREPPFDGEQLYDYTDEQIPESHTTSFDVMNFTRMTPSPASSNEADPGDLDTTDIDFTDIEDVSTQGEEPNDPVEIPVGQSSLHDIDL